MGAGELSTSLEGFGVWAAFRRVQTKSYASGLRPVSEAFQWLAELRASLQEPQQKVPVLLPKTPTQKKKTRGRRPVHAQTNNDDDDASNNDQPSNNSNRLRNRMPKIQLQESPSKKPEEEADDDIVPFTPFALKKHKDWGPEEEEEGNEVVPETETEDDQAEDHDDVVEGGQEPVPLEEERQDVETAIEKEDGEEKEPAEKDCRMTRQQTALAPQEELTIPPPTPPKRARTPRGKAAASHLTRTPNPTNSRLRNVTPSPRIVRRHSPTSARAPPSTKVASSLAKLLNTGSAAHTARSRNAAGTPIPMKMAESQAKQEAAAAKKAALLAEKSATAKAHAQRIGIVRARAAQQEKERVEKVKQTIVRHGLAPPSINRNKPASPVKLPLKSPAKLPVRSPAVNAAKTNHAAKRQELRKKAEEKRREEEALRLRQAKDAETARKANVRAAAEARRKQQLARKDTAPAPASAASPVFKPPRAYRSRVSNRRASSSDEDHSPPPRKARKVSSLAQTRTLTPPAAPNQRSTGETGALVPPDPEHNSSIVSDSDEDQLLPETGSGRKIRRDTFGRSGEAGSTASSATTTTSTRVDAQPEERAETRSEESPQEETREDETRSRPDSYPMTPLRQLEPSTADNYNIDDLRSDDETDDECDPRKHIPDWAMGTNLKASLIRQFHSNAVDPFCLFGPTYAPLLDQMFKVQRRRFHKRTSSAVWDSPLLPPPKSLKIH